MRLVLVIFVVSISTTEAAQFLQLTDFHYDSQYSAEWGNIAEKCHNQTGVRRSKLGQFGDYACDTPRSLIRNTLTAAKSIIPDPDFIFWTGDNIPHIDDYNETYVVQSLQALTSMIDSKYPNTTVLPLFGNHDYAPSNEFPDRNCTLYNTVYNMWKHWIGSLNQDTFLKGGYYKCFLGNNVVVLALNTNLYYRFNKAIPTFSNPNDPADQFKFMTDTLDAAESQHQTVHVIAHISPGVFDRTPNFTWMVPQYNQRFIDITVRYANTIKWMIFGHHHTDTFHIVKDRTTKQPVQVYLMAPAVTPWFSSLEGAGANNPAFRVFDYDPNTQQLLDAKTYYVDLDKLNKNALTPWELEYSMSQTYGINAINAKTMNDVLNKLKTDDQMFMKYIEYNSVRWNYSMPVGKFRAAQLCSIEYPDFEGYDSCMSNWASTTSVGSSVASSRHCKKCRFRGRNERLIHQNS